MLARLNTAAVENLGPTHFSVETGTADNDKEGSLTDQLNVLQL